MPRDSEDVALAWLSSHYPDTAGRIITAQTKSRPVPPRGAVVSSSCETEGDGVEVMLSRLRVNEAAAWQALELELMMEGKDRSQPRIETRTKHYNLCADARQGMEERYLKYQLESGQCMRTADGVLFLSTILERINTPLSSLPYAAGPRANPTDPTMAIDVLRDEVGKMRQVIIEGLEKLKEEFGGAEA